VPARARARGLASELLRERVRAAIRDAIASGTLKPGDQLVEDRIARDLGVSRSPVREALRQLEQHGLVVSIPNRGSFVAALTPEDVEEVTLLRGALEGLAARLAADRMGRRDLRTLEEIVDRMGHLTGRSADEERGFVEADAEFHEALVRFAGHRRLQQLWSVLDPFIWLLAVRDPANKADLDRAAIAAEHRELLDALAAGEPERAQQALWHHIVRGWPTPPGRSPAAATAPKR
jgi:DNA-binding GntR family transcriptional regulator